jgi:hypothetical protein
LFFARWEKCFAGCTSEHGAHSKEAEEQFEQDGEGDENDEREQEYVRPAEHVTTTGLAFETESLQRSFTVRALRHDSKKLIRVYRSTQTQPRRKWQ